MLKKFSLAAVAAIVLISCAQSPTGRNQIMLFDDKQLSVMGEQTFETLKAETPISKDVKTNDYVQCIASALLRVTPEEYLATPWEVVVFDSEQVNAFALPGGNIGVYTGLLKVAENQDQLAAVIGHEIAHVMASHSNERLSTNQFIQSALALGDAGTKAYGVKYQQEIMAALGVSSQLFVTLPFSRTHESEADIIGLDLMAKAGFEPRQAVNLWQNMAAASNNNTPQFLSSHPIPENRIAELRARMPEAMATFNERKKAGRLPNCRR
ncbi:M48 family metallopeptidase [Arsukibacterium indicum]|uniref:M48 family metallopeptidase n=1 Tax=Arsukibacterium indicum TaxID=2848612 RepID=A0ABS6ML81_9GAMM|nr:M48 family metallopeptidase [Arsukibacterium indicum]MBV2129505.1 M48 family metallopeptidase [Arsukibacterium indicum]